MPFKVGEIKENKTLQVKIESDNVGYTVSFRFNDEKPSEGEVSLDGINWLNVAVLHKAIGAFVDRYAFDFAEEDPG